MVWYSVGESSYGDLRGVEQFVNSLRIAQQFLSMKRDFDALKIKQGSGDRLSANEAKRSRARQTALYQNYLRAGYPVAALPFRSRHDEVLHGNAIDVGVTTASGGNRALTSAEFSWMHTACQQRGFTWTGVNFGEPWHIEGGTRVEVLPPYPGITVSNATPSATVKKVAKSSVSQSKEDNDMAIVRNAAKGKTGFGAYFAIAPGFCRYLDADQLKRAKTAQRITKDSEILVAGDLGTLYDIFDGFGIDHACSDPKYLQKDPTGDGKGLWTLAGKNAQKVLAAVKAAS